MPVAAELSRGFGSAVVAACATGAAAPVPAVAPPARAASAVAVANGRRTICSTPTAAGAMLMTETSLFHVAERKRRQAEKVRRTGALFDMPDIVRQFGQKLERGKCGCQEG